MSGKRVQAVYVRGDQSADRYPQLVAQFQTFADQIDNAFVEAASRLGGGVRHVRFVTNSACRATVDNVVVPQSAMSSPSAIADQLASRGYNRTDRKYLFWHDSAGCGLAWGAPGDDRPGADNGYNSGPSYAAMGTGCWTWQASAHELLHTLGAVQRSAPHATLHGHCWDDQDIMCYNDGGIPNPPGGLVNVCPGAPENQLDCGGDDYFHTNPPAASYLATHWNVARSQYLVSSGSGAIVGIGGKCVDVNGSGTADGTAVQLWGCNGTGAQQWSRTGDTLRALGKCMDVNNSGTADGTVVQLWTCNGTGAQVWSRVGTTLRNPQSGKCLDASGGSSADGTRLVIWTCTGGANQNWQL
ncbi:ricin-type beta-trefoil lectin domain protein [Lentzea atacamensis]|uniref:ricin-type beta-trefoil lectin domain protein n=1 Tax=Lentzea atacamensis TaxID=531938 RepID=UPI001F161B5E|nr:ricin-type beta-trefoil lectin domain protein [Lentzea atacamensis]